MQISIITCRYDNKRNPNKVVGYRTYCLPVCVIMLAEQQRQYQPGGDENAKTTLFTILQYK